MVEKQITNPVKAIRAHCVECSGGNVAEVSRCVIPKCPLYPFRMGKNPFRTKREFTEEQKEALVARLAAKREAKQADD